MNDITILNGIDPVGNIILTSDKVYRGINKEYVEEYATFLTYVSRTDYSDITLLILKLLTILV